MIFENLRNLAKVFVFILSLFHEKFKLSTAKERHGVPFVFPFRSAKEKIQTLHNSYISRTPIFSTPTLYFLFISFLTKEIIGPVQTFQLSIFVYGCV